MIVYVLFFHKKSVSKRKVCIIFIKNSKFKKSHKNLFSGFLGGFFGWVFLGGLFIANPGNSCGQVEMVGFHPAAHGVQQNLKRP
jgi:hypothetical protein